MSQARRRQERRPASAVLALAVLSALAARAEAQLPLEGAEAEAFLRSASVVTRKPIGSGITESQKLTLSDGTRTTHAAWKTIHQHFVGMQKMVGGRQEFDFRDSWKHDVAAYELDKLLGIGLVPPTVERHIEGRTGALQLWIEHATDEHDRRHRHLQPPNLAIWNARQADERLLRELAYDTDFNIHNTLYDPAFRVYAIDFSRAFRIQPQLLDPGRLDRFSRAVLERLRALDRPTLEARLSPWLDRLQIAGLLSRRDRILELVEKRIAAQGEAQTLTP